MTAHYARLNDATVRRPWEHARKVNARGETVTLDLAGRWPRRPGPSSESAGPPRRCRTATTALPVVQTCPTRTRA
jgi:hypothetical protein